MNIIKAKELIEKMTRMNLNNATTDEVRTVGRYCTMGQWCDAFRGEEDIYIKEFNKWVRGD